MSSDHLMTKEELQYFTENFAENQKNGALNLDFFFNICRSYNKILNKTVLEESLKDIKTSLEKKNSTQQITIKQDEYFNYINTILKDQFQFPHVHHTHGFFHPLVRNCHQYCPLPSLPQTTPSHFL